MVQKNAHCLEGARPALEILERSNCVRIECAEPVKTNVTIAVPRMPKLAEMRQFTFSDPSNKLMTQQSVFRFSDRDGIHLSYFFDADPKEEWLRFYEPFRLGHGESLCVSKANLIDSLPAKTDGMQVWEPTTGNGRQMRVLHAGLLNDLVLYHNHRKSSTEVEQKVAFFATEPRQRRLLYRFYRDGELISFPQHVLAQVAGMMRHAVINQVPNELKQYASNHGEPQLQYLPLPTLGQYSDGRIRRAVIVDTLGSLPIHRVSELVMTDLKGNPFTAVRETVTDGVFERYLTPSRCWVSVTPVLLNGYDTKHGKKNLKKRQKMLEKMFRVVGLPVPRAIQTFSTGADFEVSNKYAKNYIMTMLAVEFETEVAGMLAIGAGRNTGMGVFANLAASATD
jgi:CRISPR-associated protein Csb2